MAASSVTPDSAGQSCRNPGQGHRVREIKQTQKGRVLKKQGTRDICVWSSELDTGEESKETAMEYLSQMRP